MDDSIRHMIIKLPVMQHMYTGKCRVMCALKFSVASAEFAYSDKLLKGICFFCVVIVHTHLPSRFK